MLKPYRIPRYKCQLIKDGHLPLFIKGRIDEATAAVKVFAISLAGLPHEEIHMLMLNGAGRPIGLLKVSQGGLHGCAITARDILRPVVAAGGAAFVLAHNHPSGDPTPSTDDREMTKHITKCAELLGIPMLDHLVVCPETRLFCSVTDELSPTKF